MLRLRRLFGVLLFLFASTFFSTQIASAQSSTIYPLIVDYGQTLEQVIAAGQYDYVPREIIEEGLFSVKKGGKVKRSVALLHYSGEGWISTRDVVKDMARHSLRPATIEELLAFGAQYPEKQRRFAIVALGSQAQVDGDWFVPCLDKVGAGRGLYLVGRDGRWGWDGYYSFLAVRK